jgi:threonine dehydrogenase-like Zn-dependent dehydrogenase
VSGAGNVTVIGAPAAGSLALAMGADQTIDLDRTTAEERRTLVRDATRGRGADVVIEAAGSGTCVEEGVELARDGGTYVIAGHYTTPGTAPSMCMSRSTASTSTSAAAGAARCATSSARSRRSSDMGHVPWQSIGSAPLRAGGHQRAPLPKLTVTKALVNP